MRGSVRLGLVGSPMVVVVLSAAALHVAANSWPVEPGALIVHEWGTFTSIAGEDGAAVDWDALACKDDLPGFVNDFGFRGFKWRLQGTVRMETPVLYFYATRELEARVRVTFPQGVITEWYPQAEPAVYQRTSAAGVSGPLHRLAANLNGIDTSLRSLTGTIEWKRITVQPASAPAVPVEGRPSRYYAARETDASPIAVGTQHEKFLFYRGVGRFQVPLSAHLSGTGQIIVENHGSHPIPTVILFEKRKGQLGYRRTHALGNAGPESSANSVTLDAPSLDESLLRLRADLESALVADGLFPLEAHAMVKTWQDSWFEEGSRLIYILPSPAVDALLPLMIEPAPSETARVFVGRIELLTPATVRSVEAALAAGDWTSVDRYGRLLDPILKRIDARDPSKASQVEQFRRSFRESAGASCYQG